MITHHQGKSRVFHTLGKSKNQVAIVDEDPGSVKTSYEKTLKFVEESDGLKYFIDKSGNKIFTLKGKLENGIIYTCNINKIKTSAFGLPEKPDDLHDVVNQKLVNFEKLINDMVEKKVSAIGKLKSWIEG